MEGRTEQFDAALTKVNRERGNVYGSPLVNFNRIAAAEPVIATCPDPEVRQALYMIWGKICRLVQSPDHLDSAIDIAGYARVICMIHDERRPAQEKDEVRIKWEDGKSYIEWPSNGRIWKDAANYLSDNPAQRDYDRRVREGQ